MSWRLPATVVLLLYLSLNSLSPHPVFYRLTEPTATSLLPALATLRHPPHTRTHTPRHNHTPRTASRDTIRRHHTPPHFATHTHSRIESLVHSQSDTRRYSVKVVLAEPLEDAAHMFLVFRFVIGEHENVV